MIERLRVILGLKLLRLAFRLTPEGVIHLGLIHGATVEWGEDDTDTIWTAWFVDAIESKDSSPMLTARLSLNRALELESDLSAYLARATRQG